MFSGLIFGLLTVFSSSTASASQALLDCFGPKVKLEAWFSGGPTPKDIIVYEIDPSLGVPAQYQLLDFQWTHSNLNFKIKSDEGALLEFQLLYDSINGGFSGALIADTNTDVNLIYPNHRCEFK